MDKLTQEELNALSPRARKAHEDKGDNVISEILTENPNVIKEDKPAKKKKENPMYKVRDYKKKNDFDKGEKVEKTTFTEGIYVVSFD